MENTADIPPEMLLYRYELREQISGGACRLAAKFMTGWQIDRLRALALQFDEAAEAGDREAGYLANIAFHKFLLENCGNPLLRNVWESQHLMPSRSLAPTFEDELTAQISDDSVPSMKDVVDAIASHDPHHAEGVMKCRIHKITEGVRRIVNRFQSGKP